MNAVFADTVYWIAIVKPNDPWSNDAKEARQTLGPVRILTTDEVLTEFLAALSKTGPNMRSAAVKMVQAIVSDPNVRVVPQSRESFNKGLDRYAARSDKQYSLQDCISMNVMETEKVDQVLTNDHHFEQEGFTILMKNDSRKDGL